MLDEIKAQGYKYSTISGITVAVSDATIPAAKKDILAAAEKEIDEIRVEYAEGFLSDSERYNAVLRTWEKATNDVTDALQKGLDRYNPIYMMADSGARGSMSQIRQLAGMRGLIANTSGKTIEIPIRANYREGLNIFGILHLLPRRPEGLGRYRPAYRRLRLPDPPPGGRLPGSYHPGGRLRHHRWPGGL